MRTVTAIIAALGALPTASADNSNLGGAFLDRFATLDSARWYVSNGWANGPYQACTWSTENARLSNQGLVLSITNRATPERKFSCAELQSTAFYSYGTYEARIRAAAGSGLVTAFFTYSGPAQSKDTPHDEIDFEFLGKNKGVVELNYFVNGNKEGHGRHVELKFDASATVNDYAFEWLPDSLRWFVNGKLVYEALSKPDDPLPSHPGKIFLSLWAGAGEDMGWWLGPFTYPGVPITATVEYVAFTPQGAGCQFETSIVCARGK